MKKVDEPVYDTNWCRRCDKDYCVDCVSFETVDFDIEEITNENHPNPNVPRIKENWKGEEVCPHCYNQLLEKKKNET